MKKQLLVIFLITIVLATLFVAGCTGGVTNATSPTPVASTARVSPAPTRNTATIPSAKEFTDRWVRYYSNDSDYTVITPFTKEVNERGHATFTGVIRAPYDHGDQTEIFELCKDKADAQQTYQ